MAAACGSARTAPAPACYGHGGTEPTVTDGHVVLGYLDPDYPLGGNVALDRAAAERALATLADPLDMTVIELAAGIAEISNAQMADLMRKVTVERGLDPRGFTVFAYGGAGPVYAPFLARQIGARVAYVPADSGMFSALGMLTTDLVFTEERSLRVRRSAGTADVTAANALYDELAGRLVDRFVAEGFAAGESALARSVDMRFVMQVHELAVDVPDGPLTAGDLERIGDDFVIKYEQTYDKNSAYLDAGMEMVTFRVTGQRALDRPKLDVADANAGAVSLIGHRDAHFAAAGGFVATALHAGDRLVADQQIAGPAIVQRLGDTVVIPPHARVVVDAYGSLRITWEEATP